MRKLWNRLNTVGGLVIAAVIMATTLLAAVPAASGEGRGSAWGTKVHEMVEAHDAAVAHAARVGVFKTLLARARNLGISWQNDQFIQIVASEHSITPAELEPVKVYGKDDITTDMYHFVADGDRYRVCTEDRAFVWHDKTGEWKSAYEGCGPFFYETTAKAIAAKLRADGNYPKGGGK